MRILRVAFDARAFPSASYRKVNTMRELTQDEQRQVAGGSERGNTGANGGVIG